MAIGTKIRKLRVENELTQDYVAEKLGISQNAFSKIERGETDPTYSTLSRLAEILKTNISHLVDIDGRNMSFTINDNKDNSQNGYIVHPIPIQVYEKFNEHLMSENAYLKKNIGFVYPINTKSRPDFISRRLFILPYQ